MTTAGSSRVRPLPCRNGVRFIWEARHVGGRHRDEVKRRWRLRAEQISVPVNIHYLTSRMKSGRRHALGRPPDFRGGVLDIGAPRSLIGLKQARAYCRAHGIRLKLAPSQRLFRFGTYPTRSLGTMNILVQTPGGLMSLTVDVVPEDVPLLIGLDVMDRHTLQALTVENKLENVSEGWKMPTVRRDGHVVL